MDKCVCVCVCVFLSVSLLVHKQESMKRDVLLSLVSAANFKEAELMCELP